MVVKYPGLALTVSLNPRSLGSGGSIGPVADGVGSMPPGTPFGPLYFAWYAAASNGVRPMTWKQTRCVCMGWVSSVRLTYTQSSTVPTFGVSVAPSGYCIGTA